MDTTSTIALFLFILSIIGLVFHFINKKKLESSLNRKLSWSEYTKLNKELKTNNSEVITQSETQESNSDYPKGTPVEIIEAYERQRYDVLRVLLQKVSYTLVGNQSTQEEKAEFTKIMKYFATRDPLYKEMIVKIIPIVAKQEGMIQSNIYPYVSEYDVEWVRYVLYFAHELGDIRREKKGRSYKLYTATYFEHEVLENKM